MSDGEGDRGGGNDQRVDTGARDMEAFDPADDQGAAFGNGDCRDGGDRKGRGAAPFGSMNMVSGRMDTHGCVERITKSYINILLAVMLENIISKYEVINI